MELVRRRSIIHRMVKRRRHNVNGNVARRSAAAALHDDRRSKTAAGRWLAVDRVDVGHARRDRSRNSPPSYSAAIVTPNPNPSVSQSPASLTCIEQPPCNHFGVGLQVNLAAFDFCFPVLTKT